MTAQIIELNAAKATNTREKYEANPDWTQEWEPKEREVLAAMFMNDLIGVTDICECGSCKTRDEDIFFDKGCPSCGETEDIKTNLKITVEDILEKWQMGWGWIYGGDLEKPMGCIGNMDWGHFDTTRNTLTYDNGSEYVTLALPPSDETILDLEDYGFSVLKFAQKHKAKG